MKASKRRHCWRIASMVRATKSECLRGGSKRRRGLSGGQRRSINWETLVSTGAACTAGATLLQKLGRACLRLGSMVGSNGGADQQRWLALTD